MAYCNVTATQPPQPQPKRIHAMPTPPYIGRFAPSPTGALHAGSLVAALASWLDARAHGGRWLVRIEDIDAPRCSTQAQHTIMRQLEQHALLPDAAPVLQSHRTTLYQSALRQLLQHRLAYPCTCSRKQIAAALANAGNAPERHAGLIYPGTCRPILPSLHTSTQASTDDIATFDFATQAHTAWRLHIAACLQRQGIAEPSHITHWHDRHLGAQKQCVAHTAGDFVLRRADGLWAYQLAVVVDDAAQGITHIVRGADLADNTPRQIVLQQALGLPTPLYLHTPLVCLPSGEKLSKQTGAAPLPEGHNSQSNRTQALANLQAAALVLGLPPSTASSPAQALQQWVAAWVGKWCKNEALL